MGTKLHYPLDDLPFDTRIGELRSTTSMLRPYEYECDFCGNTRFILEFGEIIPEMRYLCRIRTGGERSGNVNFLRFDDSLHEQFLLEEGGDDSEQIS